MEAFAGRRARPVTSKSPPPPPEDEEIHVDTNYIISRYQAKDPMKVNAVRRFFRFTVNDVRGSDSDDSED